MCTDMITELNTLNLGEEFTKLIINKCEDFKNMIKEINQKKDDILDINNYDDFCEKTKNKIYKNLLNL